jgi:hypothetical protein
MLPSRVHPAALTEYQIKAAFLYNFAKYVEWPADTPGASKPFTLGILGKDPFGTHLNELEGKTVHDRQLVFKRLANTQEAAGCQVLFISRSEEGRLDQILASLDGTPVLTVSDMHRFTQRGGMVGFSMEEQKVRFNVNLKAAETHALRISSQLLKLAKNVQGKPLPGED